MLFRKRRSAGAAKSVSGLSGGQCRTRTCDLLLVSCKKLTTYRNLFSKVSPDSEDKISSLESAHENTARLHHTKKWKMVRSLFEVGSGCDRREDTIAESIRDRLCVGD